MYGQRGWTDETFLCTVGTDITGSTGGNNGQKFYYSWVANPWSSKSVNVDAGGNADLAGAWHFWHMDVAAKPPPDSTGHDETRPCKPGQEYLRKLSDKNAATVAICVDNSRQATAGWFWMHGNGSTRSGRGWKNELFGDGHAESRRPDECRPRWGQPFGSGNGPTGW
jgi:hypothetical protein